MNDNSKNNCLKKIQKNGCLIQTLKDENLVLKEDNDDLLRINEELAGQVNTLTVKSEISRLEFIQVFDAVSDPLWIIDKKRNVLYVNRSFVTLFKLEDKDAAVGKKCYNVLNTSLCQTDNCPIKYFKNTRDRIELEIILEIEKGIDVPFLLTGSPLLGLVNESIGAVVQFKDISERKAYEETLEKTNKKLETLSRIDELTQIANRRVFDETLQKEWKRMQRSHLQIALLMIDIDFFKSYNDNYGHAQGDKCLRQVADAIGACIHRSHDLAARYGGEEFACILPETDLNGAAAVAESVLNAVRNCKILHECSKIADIVTVSIGCFSMIPEQNDDCSILIIEADQLLYKSKESGRNRFITRK